MSLEALISELKWHRDRAKIASDANIANGQNIKKQAELKLTCGEEYTFTNYVSDLIFAENRTTKGSAEWNFHNVLDELIKKYGK